MSTKWIYAIGLVIAVFIGFYVYQKYRVAPSIQLSQLNLTNLNGEKVEIEQFKGKRVVVCFGASWCINCREELEIISALNPNDLQQFEILVISDESREKIQRFKDKTAYPFTFLKLETSFSNLGIYSIPTTYLVNKNLKVVKETVGYMNWNDASTLEHFKKLMD